MKIDKHHIGQLIRGLKWSSGIAAMIVGILLTATVIQTKLHDPIMGNDFTSIYQLLDKNADDQNLRDEVRALDMLARKAYFTSVHQQKIGTIIFFIALAAFLILWNLQTALFPPIPSRPGEKGSWWREQTQSAKAAAALSAAIVIIVITYGLFQKYDIIAAITAKRDRIIERALSVEEHARWWMNFRGPDGIGIAKYTNAPTSFDGESMTNIKWKTEVPLEGFSSPVVYEGMIFLTGGTKESRQVFAFDVDDGRLVWTYDVKVIAWKSDGKSADSNLQFPKVDKETGYAAPSAACDGNRVYAIFATGEMVALTLTGKLVWSKFLGVPENHYGHSSSLITHGGRVFVQFDQYDVGKLFAFDGKTGNVVWQADRERLSWASPIIVNTGNRYELIVVDNEYAASYDPVTGEKLWDADCLYGEVGPSAAYANGKVFTANEYASATGLDVSNINEDGVPAKLWSWRSSLPNTASPVSVDSLLFLAASNGTVTCLDNRTGEEYWVHEFERGFYSSPIAVGDNVFLFDKNGVMQVFAASPKFTLINSSAIGEPVTTTPAILDGYMIVRGDKYLYRIDQ